MPHLLTLKCRQMCAELVMVGGVKQFMVCPSEVVMLSRQPNNTASSPRQQRQKVVI